MAGRKLHSMYELKGRLEAREIILQSDLDSLSELQEQVESDFYKGHTLGRIEMGNRWLRENAIILECVSQIIEEAESGR